MFSAALGLAVLAAGRSRRRCRHRAPEPGLTERDVRLGLERSYRMLATLETDNLARYELVDLANSVRPRTVI